MAVCVTLATTQGPDPVVDSHGNASYAWFTVDPSTTDLSQCPYVLQTYGEIQAGTGAETFFGSVLSMSSESALQVSGAVGLLWAAAFVIRELTRFLRSREYAEDD